MPTFKSFCIVVAAQLALGAAPLAEVARRAGGLPRAAWGGELNGAPMEGTTCHYLWPKWITRPADFAFMMEEGKFVRYDVGTDKETAPGGGKVGMSVDELQKLYGGALKASPHKYTQGGQYLAMDAGDVAPTQLIFEADANGKVTAWRVGLSPQVAYVEGCS